VKEDITRQICHVCHKPFYECDCELKNIPDQNDDEEFPGFDENKGSLE
jgi:hypothetical protein